MADESEIEVRTFAVNTITGLVMVDKFGESSVEDILSMSDDVARYVLYGATGKTPSGQKTREVSFDDGPSEPDAKELVEDAEPEAHDVPADATTPVNKMGLSNRALNALLKHDIGTIGELQALTHKRAKGLKGMGDKSFEEIVEAMAKYDLKFADAEPENETSDTLADDLGAADVVPDAESVKEYIDEPETTPAAEETDNAKANVDSQKYDKLREECRGLFHKIYQKDGMAVAVKVISPLGFERLREVPDDKLQAVIDLAEKHMAGKGTDAEPTDNDDEFFA